MKRIIYKLFKCIILLFIGILMFNIFEPKPFKFESFKTKEEAQVYFDKHYPVGSNVNILLDDLKKVGCDWAGGKKGEIERSWWPKEDFEYSGMYGCEYCNNLLSKDPFKRYVITIYTDKEDRIIEAYIAKHSLWA